MILWISIFSSFSHPCEVTDVIFGVGLDMLTDMESMVGVACAGDMRAGVPDDLLTVLIIDVTTASDIDILADKNANGLAAVMTPLEFTLPAP